jgi:hypothetical protein
VVRQVAELQHVVQAERSSEQQQDDLRSLGLRRTIYLKIFFPLCFVKFEEKFCKFLRVARGALQ